MDRHFAVRTAVISMRVLLEETGASGENPRLSAERWLTSHTSGLWEIRTQPATLEVKGACSTDNCATEAPDNCAAEALSALQLYSTNRKRLETRRQERTNFSTLRRAFAWNVETFVFSYRPPRLKTFPVCYPIRSAAYASWTACLYGKLSSNFRWLATRTLYVPIFIISVVPTFRVAIWLATSFRNSVRVVQSIKFGNVKLLFAQKI